jgi:ABC-type branched-subunit amino acid transport system substrate-binding protein
MKRVTIFRFFLVVLALALVACGGGEAEEDGHPIYLMGADGLLSATFFENVGEDGLGMYFSGPGQPSTGAYSDFVSKYEERYGEGPIQSFHARAYDAANMVFDAIEAVAEVQADGTIVIDRQALIEAIYTTEHQGLTGTLRCNEFGDCASPVIAIFRYEDLEGGVEGVLSNVQRTFDFEASESGVGVVPAAPAGYSVGQVTIEPGAPIEIATLQAISGAVTNLGTDQVRGVEIAIDDRGGTLLDHPLELSMNEDDLCSSEGGTTGAQRIIANTQIVAVIGTSCSGAGVPASEALSEAGILVISGSNTAPVLTATGYFSDEGPQQGEAWSYGYFRTAHNDEFQGRAAAQFSTEDLGVTLAATINDGDPYTQGLTGAFGGSFAEFGGEVGLATAVGAQQEDMRSTLTEVEASGAEILFFPIFEPAGNFIVLQARDVALDPISE